jgi:hypothetical protein
MNVRFALLDRDGSEYDEAASAVFSLSGQLPCAPGDFDGLLRIDADGQEPVALRDDLYDLIPSACVEAALQCRDTGTGHFDLATVYAEFELATLDGHIRLSEMTQPPSLEFAPRLYPREALLAQLLDCARRFERFLALLVERDAEWQPALERLRAGLQAADADGAAGQR